MYLSFSLYAYTFTNIRYDCIPVNMDTIPKAERTNMQRCHDWLARADHYLSQFSPSSASLHSLHAKIWFSTFHVHQPKFKNVYDKNRKLNLV